MTKKLYPSYVKRILDIIISFTFLLLFSPFLLLVIILQILFNGFPIFFSQERIGKNEKIFKIYKFRSMKEKRDIFGTILPDSKRVTVFGKIIRITSIDELPNLYNVLKGDMSLIGPRPLLVEYLPLYTESQKKRHLVRPGLSGLAQVSGRNHLSWSEKIQLDLLYINKISFITDFIIILKTLIYIFNFRKVESPKGYTSESFNGKN